MILPVVVTVRQKQNRNLLKTKKASFVTKPHCMAQSLSAKRGQKIENNLKVFATNRKISSGGEMVRLSVYISEVLGLFK